MDERILMTAKEIDARRVLNLLCSRTGYRRMHYLVQSRFAQALLKIYPVEAIIGALRGPEGVGITSLGSHALVPLIEKAQEKLDSEAMVQTPVRKRDAASLRAPESHRPAYVPMGEAV